MISKQNSPPSFAFMAALKSN